MWLEAARADRRVEGFRRFWFGWRRGDARLRQAAYERGRFTPEARRLLDQYQVLQVPSGVAWVSAVLAVSLVPRWLPRSGALPRTPWVGAACLHPLPLIAGVARALTPEVVAHEFAHVIWPRLPRSLRAGFGCVRAGLEENDPRLGPWLDQCLSGYKDRRSDDECHVRLLEYYEYGRREMPAVLRPYYEGWVDLTPRR